jgi:SPP1 gp7 family putative phage head morphogenesis protein
VVFVLRIKTDFAELTAKLSSIPDRIDDELAPILNRHGYEMTNEATGLIASRLGVSEDEVATGLTQRYATELDPEYEVVSNGEKFRYFRWITSQDEKVCPICAPRDGLLYTELEIRYSYPAHPNCRCQLEPVDLGGELVKVAEEVMPGTLNAVAQEILDVFSREWGA